MRCVYTAVYLILGYAWSISLSIIDRVNGTRLTPPISFPCPMHSIQIPRPPSSEPYVGTYANTSAGITVIVVEVNKTLVAEITSLSVYLAYSGEGVFQMFAPPELLPCMTGELLALSEEWVYFANLQDGVYHTVTVPGFFYGIEFNRSK